MEWLLSLLGGGDPPGTESQQLGARTSGDLSALVQNLGFAQTPGAITQGAGGQRQSLSPQQLQAILSLFKKDPFANRTPMNQGFDTPTGVGDISSLA